MNRSLLLKSLKKEWIAVAVLFIPFVLIAWYWSAIPETVPIHWNLKGEIDDYAPKFWGVFLAPCAGLLLYCLLLLLPTIDPRRKNYETFRHSMSMLRLTLAVFFLAVVCAQLSAALYMPVKSGDIFQYAIIGLFVVLGNFMTTFKSNFFFGIRTPWTLSDEEVWRKTHRLTAYLWTGGGILMFALKLAVPSAWYVLIFTGGLTGLVCIPVFYSYLIYKALQKKSGGLQ